MAMGTIGAIFAGLYCPPPTPRVMAHNPAPSPSRCANFLPRNRSNRRIQVQWPSAGSCDLGPCVMRGPERGESRLANRQRCARLRLDYRGDIGGPDAADELGRAIQV